MRVEIEYCVPCGYLDRAIEAQRAILEAFGQRLEAVSLRTGEKGVFTFTVGNDVVYAKPEEFNLEEVVARIGQRVRQAEAA